MNHQLYETWILDEVELTREQIAELDLHLTRCETCRQLKDTWNSVSVELSHPVMASPKPDFAARWQASLPARRLKKEMEQVKRWLFSIGGAAVLSLAALIISTAGKTSLTGWLVTVFDTGVHVYQDIVNFVNIVWTLILSLPLPVVILSGIVLASWVAIILCSWTFAVWRLNKKGVTNQ